MVKDRIYTSPESEGLSSNEVLRFIDFIDENKINLHSFLLVRHGKILYEGYYKPFDENFEHRLYSCSKSVASLAVGKLVTDGLARVEDKMCDLLPEYYQAEDIPQWTRDMTLEDLLTMRVPHRETPYVVLVPGGFRLLDGGWDTSFFESKDVIKPAGTLFNYDSGASYMLCVLVYKLTGMEMIDYLRPVFDKIGVSENIKCVNSPDGHNWGASGVICTLREFAAIGELFLNKGNWGGEQLIDREYMEKATSPITSTLIDASQPLLHRGYGYQVWIQAYGYGLRGMGGQFVFCYPDKDFMFVCNADFQHSGAANAGDPIYWAASQMYHALADKPLDEDTDAQKKLSERTKALSLPLGYGEKSSPAEDSINGVTYELGNNKMGIKNIRFDFSADGAVMTYENERGVKRIPFGRERYVPFNFPETHYYGMVAGQPAGKGQKALATGAWTTPRSLLVNVHIIDTSLGTMGMRFEFDGDRLVCAFTKRCECFMGEYSGYACGYARK